MRGNNYQQNEVSRLLFLFNSGVIADALGDRVGIPGLWG